MVNALSECTNKISEELKLSEANFGITTLGSERCWCFWLVPSFKHVVPASFLVWKLSISFAWAHFSRSVQRDDPSLATSLALLVSRIGCIWAHVIDGNLVGWV